MSDTWGAYLSFHLFKNCAFLSCLLQTCNSSPYIKLFVLICVEKIIMKLLRTLKSSLSLQTRKQNARPLIMVWFPLHCRHGSKVGTFFCSATAEICLLCYNCKEIWLLVMVCVHACFRQSIREKGGSCSMPQETFWCQKRTLHYINPCCKRHMVQIVLNDQHLQSHQYVAFDRH